MATDEAPPRLSLSSKLRRGPKDAERNGSSSSAVSQPADDAPSAFQQSLDGVIGKLKDRTHRKSSDDRRSDESGSTKRLSRLVPTTKKSRRKSRDLAQTRSTSDDLLHDHSRGTSPNPSELSLGLQGSGHSSLMTEDSDDQSIPQRPTLSPHQSHTGYLTLSSPLINATATTEHDQDHDPDPSRVSIADTLAGPDSTTQESLPPPPHPSAEHQRPPADKSRGAFSLPRKKLSSTDAPSSDNLVDQPHDDLPRVDSLEHSAPRPSTPQSLSRKLPVITTDPSTPPNTVSTPTTFVTPPTPTSPPLSSNAFSQSTNTSPVSVNSAPQRRKRAGTFTSSKLSTAISASPLTPHIEEAKTPGGTLTAPTGTTPSGGSSFFSSVFSAAQNAANQLSNSLNTSIASTQKNKSPQLDQKGAAGGEEVIPGPEASSIQDSDLGTKRQLAVETLGRGDLSLEQLGITESSEDSPMASTTDLPNQSSTFSRLNGNTQKQEENAAQRAISVAYEKPVESAVAQATGGRPLSVVSADGSDAGLQNSPRASTTFDGIKRAGSVRSKVSARRRHRGSSAATGGTLAAAITASTAALAHPGVNGPGHRPTGFAVASSKRNKDFHQLFRSVPEDDYLIEDYSAALQRDILLHGRIYVSEGHICFSSNILGWVTNLVISFDEVVSVEKKSTAVIFPNAIVIQTLHARNVFASLVARDSTYELIVGIWKISHPNLKSSLHGVAIDDLGTGDKTERAESIASEGEDDSDQASDDDDDDDVYDEDEEHDDMASSYEPGGSVAGSEIGDPTVSRKISSAPVTVGPPATNGTTKGLDFADPAPSGATTSADCPGPAAHAPTECSDQDTHYDRPLTDTTIPAPLGKVYSLMWGPNSGNFMKKWLVDDQKSRELSYEDDKTGMDDAHRTFTYSYIKPLSAPVGPKQTKCIVTCTLETFDLEKAISVNCSTVTPDVPSGNIFTTKTKYCMMWGPGNSTRLVASCSIEWTGKSWLRGPIEKGANDGQTQYMKDLVASLRAAVTAKALPKGVTRGKGKGKRKNDPLSVAAEGERIAVATVKAEQETNWGLLEPIRGPLEPFVSILQPLFSPQIIITILMLLLAYTWLFPSRQSAGLGFPIDSPGRLAAYEEIWRREESELWDWLEDRVGLSNGVPVGGGGGAPADSNDKNGRQKVLGVKKMGRRLRNQNVEERQVDDAIRITEERLSALKDAVKNRKTS